MNKLFLNTVPLYLILVGVFVIVLQNAGIISRSSIQDVSIQGSVDVEVGNTVEVDVGNTVDVEVGNTVNVEVDNTVNVELEDIVSFNLAEVAGKKIKLTETSWDSKEWNLTGDKGILSEGASINWGSVLIQK